MMQLTKGFEQAACIISLLATQNRGVPISSQVINARLGGSQTYLRKIMRKLVVAGLVKSISGNNGGFTLARDAKDINLLEIVEATEGKIETYPNYGFFDRVFREFKQDTKKATAVINNVFTEADKRWADYLASQTVYQLISATFGESEIPLINWNEEDISGQHKLIIQKIVENVTGNHK